MAAIEKRGTEMLRFFEFFKAAFDELHESVVKHVTMPNQYIDAHHDYPRMSFLDSGFPIFREAGFYSETPRDYVGTVRPRGLFAALRPGKLTNVHLPKGAELANFLRQHEIGKRLDLDRFVFDGKEYNTPVEHMVEDAVERYLHLRDLGTKIDVSCRDDVIWPLVCGTGWPSLDLRLVVPIIMTHFEVDHFSLTESTYITRLPKKLQLARARISTPGTGVSENVVGAATHAFVSKDWRLKAGSKNEVRESLNHASANVVDAIESFFGAMRTAIGVSTGYAQVLWMPRNWALEYFCDLPPLYGIAMRQYPSDFDNYGWTRSVASVNLEQLKEVRRVYRALLANTGEAMRLALTRLNACLTRTDAVDAILDGTIGLELLLGDDQNQSLSYKLRLRAAALTLLQSDPIRSTKEVASNVKRLYETRSAIVHGRREKRSKMASEPADQHYQDDRQIAADLLRFVLDTLLTHPEYQNPSRIDEGLLLRSDVVAETRKPSSSRREGSKKSKQKKKIKG